MSKNAISIGANGSFERLARVGRIGALAVALGIGSATAVGLATSAYADTGDASSVRTPSTSRGAQAGEPGSNAAASSTRSPGNAGPSATAKSTPLSSAATSRSAGLRRNANDGVGKRAPTADRRSTPTAMPPMTPAAPGSDADRLSAGERDAVDPAVSDPSATESDPAAVGDERLDGDSADPVGSEVPGSGGAAVSEPPVESAPVGSGPVESAPVVRGGGSSREGEPSRRRGDSEMPVNTGASVSVPSSVVSPSAAGAESSGPVPVAPSSIGVSRAQFEPESFVVQPDLVLEDLVPAPAAASPVVAAVVGPVGESQVPVMTKAAPRALSASGGAVSGLSGGLLAWLQGGSGGDGPAAEPLMWTALAFTRRDLNRPGGAAPAAATTSAGEPLNPFVSPGAAATVDPFAEFVRVWIGDGTAENPNAGILVGNGYSYTSYGGACTSGACNGGNAGLLGNGGNGFAGGNGGSAGWFGDGGAGGAATTPGGTGGNGGSGGLFSGNGGAGGAGGDAVSGNGGNGCKGGDAGALSLSGTGGAGGAGGARAGDGRTGKTGSAGRSGIWGQPVYGVPPANLTGEAAPGLLVPGAIDLFLKAGALLGLQSGYVAMFARNGQVVYGTTAGYADIASGTPMTLGTKFRIASMTKPITAVSAMILVEEGRLRLEDPVSNYIPAAANLRVATSQTALPGGGFTTTAPDRPLTVRDLLTFSSGIGEDGGNASDLDKLWTDNNIYAGSGTLAERVNQVLTLPLFEQPGTQWRYGWSADVLARVVEVASGRPFGDFVTDNILEPLGMVSTEFLTGTSSLDGLATMYTQDAGGRLVPVPNPRSQSPDWTPGGSGLVSTAGDYMRFALMLGNGGTYQGTQILKPETVALMTQPQVQSGVLVDEGISGLGWGLGMSVVVDGNATATFDRTGDYWWSGFYGTTFFVSPSTGLVGVVLSQNQPGPYSPTPYVIYLTQALAFLGL